MIPAVTPPSRTFEGLDWMRFLLACYIALSHTFPAYDAVTENADVAAILHQGNLCTSAFFMLSGFLLTYVYLASGTKGAIDKRSFMVMRMSALYPLHLITFVLMLPVSFFSREAYGRLAVADSDGGAVRVLGWQETVINVINHLTLTHAWNPLYMVFNVPSWSISALVFFYVVFCFAGERLFNTGRPLLWLLLLALAFALPEAVAYLITGYSPLVGGILHRNPLARLPVFLAGVVLCRLYLRHRGDYRENAALFWTLLAFVAAVYGLEYVYNSNDDGDWTRVPFLTLLNFPAAAALIWAMAMVRPCGAGWRARWSARLGKASLSLFVLHLPLFRFIAKAERVVTDRLASTAWGKAQGIVTGDAYDPVIWLYPVYFVAVVALCVVFQERVANPVQGYLKRRFIMRPAAPDQVGAAQVARPAVRL